MKILALDSSGLVASVAIITDDVLTAEYTINYKKTHSQTLLPMLDEIKKMTELELDSVDAIAIAAGPGSFTGLRIGSATAKGLGLALDKPLIEIPTVDGLAYNLYGTDSLVCPLMDARRQQVYTGVYSFTMNKESNAYDMEALLPQCAIGIDEIIDKVNEYGRPVTFMGDGVPVFIDYIREHARVPFTLAPAHMNRQSAAALGALASIYYKEGRTVTAAEHRPDYLRLSQAERERLEKEKTDGRG